MTERAESSDHFNLLGLELDKRLTVALIAGTLLIMADYYNQFIPAEGYAEVLRAKAVERIFYYLFTPLVLILIFRDSPADYGFRLGDVRAGAIWLIGSAVVAVPLLTLAARQPEMIAYYSRAVRPPIEVVLVSGLDLLGWEFFFRGFLLFALARRLGPTAIILQAVPFALAHLGKPQLETLTTVFGGAYFGWLAWRARSFLPAFALHWFVNVYVILVALAAAG